jgi:hypothetical protein
LCSIKIKTQEKLTHQSVLTVLSVCRVIGKTSLISKFNLANPKPHQAEVVDDI